MYTMLVWFQVLLCDPMLATGGSANMAIQALVDSGVKQSAIVFVTVVVCPEVSRPDARMSDNAPTNDSPAPPPTHIPLLKRCV